MTGKVNSSSEHWQISESLLVINSLRLEYRVRPAQPAGSVFTESIILVQAEYGSASIGPVRPGSDKQQQYSSTSISLWAAAATDSDSDGHHDTVTESDSHRDVNRASDTGKGVVVTVTADSDDSERRAQCGKPENL